MYTKSNKSISLNRKEIYLETNKKIMINTVNYLF